MLGVTMLSVLAPNKFDRNEIMNYVVKYTFIAYNFFMNKYLKNAYQNKYLKK
jgi:hypothetical protein